MYLGLQQEQAIDDYKVSEDCKTKILEGVNISYWVGYEDGRDTIRKLYPDLDLSNIIVPIGVLGENPIDDTIAPTKEVAPTAIESASATKKAAPELVGTELATTEGHEIGAAAVTDIAEYVCTSCSSYRHMYVLA